MKEVKKIEDVEGHIFHYTKKPIRVRAIEVKERCFVKTREGKIVAEAGDMIIEGIEGEVYPCNKIIFKKTYDYYI